MRPGPNMIYGGAMFLFVFVVGSLLFYGGAKLVETSPKAAADGGTATSTPGGPVNVTIVARNTAFDKRTISAAPGVAMTVTLDNQDAGVLHNIAFYTSRAATEKIAVGGLIAGPAKEDLKFAAPSRPGNYYFRCDVHPDQMNGALSVKVPPK